MVHSNDLITAAQTPLLNASYLAKPSHNIPAFLDTASVLFLLDFRPLSRDIRPSQSPHVVFVPRTMFTDRHFSNIER